ncbi:MAG: ABC transporter permease [Candidatus Omnitrophica bacterium]|nr:ABC transporter permease [Candidatus Omnitrophota bacterium]
MNLKRVRAVCNKEFIQIMRDPRSLALGIVIPIILIVLFGYALSLDIENVPMAVWDQDNTKTSVDFLLNFKNSNYFQIIGYYDNYHDLERLVDFGDAMMAMVIPKDFSHYIHSNQKAPVQLILDGSDSNTAQVALGYATSVVSAYNQRIVTNATLRQGIINSVPVDLRQRIWFNQDFQSRYFIVPGLIAIIMMIISALLTSLTVAREWERGRMEQLISTPVRGIELIAGKFLPYFAIGIIDLIIAVIMGHFVFSVPLRGSLVLLFVLSSIFLTGALCLGIYISIAARNQLMASQLAMLTSFLPTFLLSGFTYEIFNMPKFVQAITYFIPARYFIVILRGIFLKKVGMRVLWHEALCLVLFAVIAVLLAVRKFKKKIPEIK